MSDKQVRGQYTQEFKLEAVGQDEVVALGGVGSKRLGLLGRCPGFDVADLDA